MSPDLPRHLAPSALFTGDRWEDLVRLLLEFEDRKRALVRPDLGPRVTGLPEARRLLDQVKGIVHAVVDFPPEQGAGVEINLTGELARLPGRCLKLLFFLSGVGGGLAFLLVRLEIDGGPAVLSWGLVLALPAVTFLIYRRTRLNLEHACSYVRSGEGTGLILIDHLPRMKFQSYLAHEYAHHLFRGHFPGEVEKWRREGWARLVQWEAALELSRITHDPSHLYPVLVQVIGELKYAVELIGRALDRQPPRQARRVRTMYHRNPLYRLATGTPGFSPESLADHALGTAAFFLAAGRPEPVLGPNPPDQ
ncbi:MAG: hypothetical protein AB1896_21785 [Thermodesulfobacteriota bacterium]